MFTTLSDLGKSSIFYALAFGLSVVTALLYPLLGEGYTIVAMFGPLAATLLMLLVVTRDGRSKSGWATLGLHRPGFSGWAPAILIPLVVLGSAYGIVWATGLAGVRMPPDIEGIPAWLVPIVVLVVIAKHVLLTGALTEEIGWRGYLLPRLAAAIGWRRALPLSGVLHGAWHLPIIFLTPVYHADGNLLIIVPLFLIGSAFYGIVEGYLRLATDSVWPSAILHGAHNVFWAVFRTATVATSPLVTEYLAGESGLLPVAFYGLVALAIFIFGHGIRQTHKLATT
jgi:membrane protease YdiL (CAAX protease family)